jgi:hypothetical protein
MGSTAQPTAAGVQRLVNHRTESGIAVIELCLRVRTPRKVSRPTSRSVQRCLRESSFSVVILSEEFSPSRRDLLLKP